MIKRKMIKRVVFIILSILIIQTAVALSCNPPSVNQQISIGQTPTSQNINCQNNNNYNVSLVGKIGDFFSLNPSSITLKNNSDSSFAVNFNQINEKRYYQGYLVFSDGTNLNININATEEEQENECRLIVMPHTTNYRIKQGETGASGEIKVKASSECGELSFNNVAPQTQMAKPMYTQSEGESIPGKEYSFVIGLDAEDINTGTYTNSYTVSATKGDNVYQKSISISTIVQIGTSPITNTTFSQLPSCSIDSDLQINSTYELVCQKDDPDMIVAPQYSEFIHGIGFSESGGQIRYKIKPVKIGTTTLKVLFLYKGIYPIEGGFEKEIRIMAGSVPVQGTELDILFYQKGSKKTKDDLSAGDTTILVRDSNTENIIPEFNIYLNGVKINNTFDIESEKDYELIIDSSGYMSRTLNFTVKKSRIAITITPDKSVYKIGEVVNITTEPGSSVLINNVAISSPYTFSTEGNLLLEAKKEGYLPSNRTLDVIRDVTWETMSPLYEDWGKGDEVLIKLTKESNWTLEFYPYEKDDDGEKVLSSEKEIIENGFGIQPEFKIKEKGKYVLKVGETIIVSKTIEGSSWLKWRNWYLWIIIPVIVVLLWVFFQNKGEGDEYLESVRPGSE